MEYILNVFVCFKYYLFLDCKIDTLGIFFVFRLRTFRCVYWCISCICGSECVLRHCYDPIPCRLFLPIGYWRWGENVLRTGAHIIFHISFCLRFSGEWPFQFAMVNKKLFFVNLESKLEQTLYSVMQYSTFFHKLNFKLAKILSKYMHVVWNKNCISFLLTFKAIFWRLMFQNKRKIKYCCVT